MKNGDIMTIKYNRKRGSYITTDLKELEYLIQEKVKQNIRLESKCGGGYAIGVEELDEDNKGTGKWWYGGCDPSNFINLTQNDEYEWRCNYKPRNIIQKISSLFKKS